MFKVITLEGTGDARGRNRWFRPVQLAVTERYYKVIGPNDNVRRIELSVNSKRAANMPPIILTLEPEDWEKVIEAVQSVMKS